MFRQIIPSIFLIIFFFIALALYTKIAGPVPFNINSVTTSKSDTFNVSGEGEVNMAPDVAVVNVGITASGSTVRQAQDQINSVINKVSDEVKKLGVDGKDIQTSNYNINPSYDFREGGQRITGYSASTNLTVKVREIDKVNQVIDVATASGANQVGGVSFEVSDKTKAENEAREKAVEDAKKKAQEAARIAGFTLGRLINYQENFAGGPQPMLLRQGAAAPEIAEDTQVEPGSSEIVVNVTLSYEIR